MDVFDRRGDKTCDYVLLRSEQVRVRLVSFCVQGLNIPLACGNRLDDFRQVRVDVRYTECGRNNSEGAAIPGVLILV